ncbi:MAG TPA: hypothetical protein PL035_01425 [Bacillota bacterium]|nr:hypothetical protein [Bacillota bacterium]HQC35729.1 hypothetical protein [Bacillota bacterium]
MARKNDYPSKTYINLAMREKRQIDLKFAIPGVILVLLLAAVFGKFGVVDRIAEVSGAQRELSAILTTKTLLEESVADYEEVKVEYAKYSINWMDDVEKSLVKKTDMIALINSQILLNSETRSITISGNTISAQLVGLDMQATADLVDRLNARDDVEQVQVFTATTSEAVGDQVIVSILVTMQLTEGGE